VECRCLLNVELRFVFILLFFSRFGVFAEAVSLRTAELPTAAAAIAAFLRRPLLDCCFMLFLSY